MSPAFVIDPLRCDGCGQCVAVCPHGAISQPGEGLCAKCVKYCLSMDVACADAAFCITPARCDGCGACVGVCPQGAIQPG